jgi:hypothetical protein
MRSPRSGLLENHVPLSDLCVIPPESDATDCCRPEKRTTSKSEQTVKFLQRICGARAAVFSHGGRNGFARETRRPAHRCTELDAILRTRREVVTNAERECDVDLMTSIRQTRADGSVPHREEDDEPATFAGSNDLTGNINRPALQHQIRVRWVCIAHRIEAPHVEQGENTVRRRRNWTRRRHS